MRTKKYIEKAQLVDYRYNPELGIGLKSGQDEINKLLDKGWQIKHVITISDRLLNYIVFKWV